MRARSPCAAFLLLFLPLSIVWAQETGFYAGAGEGVGYVDSAVPVRVRLRGVLAGDYRQHDRRNVRKANPRLDRALVGVEGELFGRVGFRVLADLRGTDTRSGLEEAWLSLEVFPRLLRVTAGLLRVPLGLEHALPEETLPFVDYAYPAALTGRTDLGLRVDGEVSEGLLSYEVTGTGGEGFDTFGQRRSGAQLAGRVVAYPFRHLDLTTDVGPYPDVPLLSGFFFSVAGSYAWGFSGHYELATSFRNKVIVTPRFEADATWAFHFGYGIDLGPVRITHEFARWSLLGVDLATGQSEDFERQNTSWSASLAWRITGETFDSRPYRLRGWPILLPERPLYADGEWGPGCIEVAFRYTNGEIDRNLIDLGFTSAAIPPNQAGLSSQESRTVDVAVNWYPFATVRLTFQLTRVIADQRPAAFDSHGRDTSFLFRLQLAF